MTETEDLSPPFTIVKARRKGEDKFLFFAIPRGRNITSFHAGCPHVIGRYVRIIADHFKTPIDKAYAFADANGLNCITKLSWTRETFFPDVLDTSEEERFIEGLRAK